MGITTFVSRGAGFRRVSGLSDGVLASDIVHGHWRRVLVEFVGCELIWDE